MSPARPGPGPGPTAESFPGGELAGARDRALVRRIAQRGTNAGEALAALFQTYAPVALALAKRVTRHNQLAEEVVQEAFFALWRSPDSYDSTRGTVRTYLLTAVHHQAVDAVRREQRHRRKQGDQVADENVEEIQDVAVEVVDRAATFQIHTAVSGALDALPDEQRTVVRMMYFDGKTQQVIADELRLPLGTVKSRALLAMRKLRASLVESAWRGAT